ncbi:MAG: V4R domain-containing protein [Gemmatimonadales bacterium]
MTTMESTTATTFLGLSPRALHTLRASLERDHGLSTAAYLQEAGFAAGRDTFEAFQTWLERTRQVGTEELDAAFLEETTSAFFGEHGWGTFTFSPLSEAVMAIDSSDWAEATNGASSQYPCCHVSSGLLADFFGRLAGETVAVMEVECRSRGDDACRFLMGSPDTLATVYERMAEGVSYAEASQTT